MRPKGVDAPRWVAWRTVYRTNTEQAYTDRAFRAEADRAGLEGDRRAFSQQLAYTAVQRRGTIDFLISEVGKRPIHRIDAPLRAALELGMAQLRWMGSVPDHAAVDTTVELVRGVMGERPVSFANAVMRRAQARADTLLAGVDTTTSAGAAIRTSLPEWMIVAMHEAFGGEGVAALVAQNAPPEGATVRRNPLVGGAADDALLPTGVIEQAPHRALLGALPEAIWVDPAAPIVRERLAAGSIVRQSASSMLATRLLAPQDGMRVLDMCAAPGGKTAHIAACAPTAQITAVELHAHRAAALEDRLRTLGVRHATVVTADARQVGEVDQLPAGSYDAVLLDAPCSGLGVLDSRPDLRWQRSADDLPGLVAVQRELLAAASRALRPGGTLVYSTCTLLPAENEQQVAWAVGHLGLTLDDPARVLPSATCEELRSGDDSVAAHCLTIWPHRHGSSGFFLARLQQSME